MRAVINKTPVVIEKVNETWIKINTDDKEVLTKISDKFTFYTDAAKFSKNKYWDGKIRLFKKREKLLYIGLFPYVKDYLENYLNCDVISDYNVFSDDIHLVNKDVMNFLKSTKLHLGGKRILPYKDQMKAFVKSIHEPKGMTISPTSSGKSLIIYLQTIFMKHVDPKSKTLIIFPTTTLIEQMLQDFVEYSNNPEFENEVQKIYGGATTVIDKNIVFSTWQSIMNEDAEYFEQFDAVIVDECHGGDAKNMKKILELSVNARYKRGYTGTLKETKLHKLVLVGVFGRAYESITYRELREQGRISDCVIKVHQLGYPKSERKFVHKMNYQEEMMHIGAHLGRNDYLTKFLNGLEGNKLVLFQRIENHGHIMLKSFQDYAIANGIDPNTIYYVDGKTKTASRNEIRKLIENNNGVTIFASYQTFSTGINIKNLQHVVLGSPYKSKIKILQSIGRGLRKDGKANEVEIHDIVDDFANSLDKLNYSMQQFNSRLRTYCQMEFIVELIQGTVSLDVEGRNAT